MNNEHLWQKYCLIHTKAGAAGTGKLFKPGMSVKGRREYVHGLTPAFSLLATPLPNLPGFRFANLYIATYCQEPMIDKSHLSH